MKFMKDAYQANIKYIFTFLVLSAFMFVIYTKHLLDVPKIGLAVVLLIAVFLLFLPKKNIAIFYALVFSGVLTSLITPVLNTPDEPVHLARTIHIVEGDLNLDNSKPLISEDFFDIYDQIKSPLTKTNLFNEGQTDKKVGFGRSTDYRATNSYWFIGYIPQAIGFGVGKFLHLSVGISYYLGRIFNALAYAVLAYIAIRLSGKAKQLIMMVAFIPMNLVLAGSYNQDSVSLGLAYIIVSLFISWVSDREKKVRNRDLILYVIICCLLATMKLPYVLLIGLLLFIPKSKFNGRFFYGKVISAVLCVGAVTVFWFLLSQQVKLANFQLEGADLRGQLMNLIHRPQDYLPVVFKEMLLSVSHLDQLFNFGWLDLSMNEVLIPIYVFYTLIALANVGRFKIPLISKIGAVLVSLAIIGLISLTLYLTWTPVGSYTVLGVQGRYYLGVLALMLPVIVSCSKNQLKFDFITDHWIVESSVIIVGLSMIHTLAIIYAVV